MWAGQSADPIHHHLQVWVESDEMYEYMNTLAEKYPSFHAFGWRAFKEERV
jgi:hypothetical protein